MNQIFLKRFMPFVLLTGTLFIQTCSDEWGRHYDEDTFNLPDKTLKEQIEEHSNLSLFSKMLQITGYDELLDASQSFTVWAPVNEALSGVDTTDTRLVLEIVRNHIARSRITTSGVESRSVRMLNGKYIRFERSASGFSFADHNVVEPDLPAMNGLVHVIDGYAPFLDNLWEYIGRTENLDSLRTYLDENNILDFDPVNSVEIGVNEDGQPIFDTVFVLTNPVLEKLGAIDSEDSIYTAILPDNSAWTEAYGRIVNYFNFPGDAGSTIRQRKLTQWTLVKDMLFHERLTEPATLDSVVTTTGNVYYNPASLFPATGPVVLSNGLAYVIGQMPYADTVSWFREIRIEAEDSEGRVNTRSNIFPRTSFGSGLDVSDNRYILVDPTSSEASVEFEIPNTLSATYNIYCVFVPGTIVNASDIIPTKVKFILTYIRRASGSTFIKRITPVDNVTSPDQMTKMLVEPFDFEYANIIDEDYDRVAVKLEVINAVTTEEEQSGDFNRIMRIDCIILEPVTE
ncbi:MAG: fasciclin domain-containing protein [Bacteroidales bacterium]|nr:fasciclin domain-containing protein [Bacteroidales bacterium]